ncbi:hypothetical protein ABT237_11525 [Streptomyces sp. NPDC001581]|uniref:HNH endonuclease n=1 Tax=Streptomyces sp. NPDC001581 TaxID=3154386 RepID=UPI003329978E
MWPLPQPRHGARDSYTTCISRTKEMGEEKRRTRLTEATDAVEEAGQQFRQAAGTKTLHTLKSENFQVPGIEKKEKVTTWLYDYGMLDGPGRDIYDELISAPKHGRCPLCGHGTVRTLDHFLPKAHFPALCVDPLNLVPACSDCNKAKSDDHAVTAEKTPFHPYLDDIDGEKWLAAKVIHEDDSVRLHFRVSPPPSWDHVLTARAHHHFRVFGLRTMYAQQANRHLGEIRGHLQGLLAAGGEETVRAHLRDGAASSLSDRPNGWHGVTYRTLAGDETFCRGAFGSG